MDLLQKLNLPVTAVSIALLSNVLLLHDSVEEEARSELNRLLSIRDKLGTSTVGDFLWNARKDVLAKMGKNIEERRSVQGVIIFEGYSAHVKISLPADCKFDVDQQVAQTRFSDVQTLDKMRDVWNTIASQTSFWRLGSEEPKSVSLLIK